MRHISCDKCGEPCTDRPALVLERKNGQTDALPIQIDLCPSCAAEFAAWLRDKAPGAARTG